MDLTILSMLTVDGTVNGAVYALMAIAIILVFSVTRILFIAQGEFIVFGAATLAQLQAKSIPSVIWLLLIAAALAVIQEVWESLRDRKPLHSMLVSCARIALIPTCFAAIGVALSRQELPLLLQVLISIALVSPLGPLLYRIVYSSLAKASVLTLLIVSVGVHFCLKSLALAFLGPEGFRTPPIADGTFSVGPIMLSIQATAVIAASALLILTMFILFTKTFRGLSLRATAVNQLGARLVGLSAKRAGMLSMALAAGLGALSGILIAPSTTIFYDTGFLIGLKGFVAAVFAGLLSFPGALVGALVVGLIESFGSFWASAFKDVIVFTAIIPILLWRSLSQGSGEEH